MATTLNQISSLSFEHPADRSALEALQKTVGFNRLMRLLARHGLDKLGRIINESSNLRLSERQLPALHAIHREVCATLDVEPPPLYLANSPIINAYTSGSRRRSSSSPRGSSTASTTRRSPA